MTEPDYYGKNGLSPLKAFEQGLMSEEEYIGFLKGNVIKYTVRAGEKTDDPLLDIVKAMDYLHYLHQALKKRNEIKKESEAKLHFSIPKNDCLEDLRRNILDFKKEYGLIDK